MYQHHKVAQYLIEKGADVNAGKIQTPLELAVVNNDPEMIKILLKAGANINDRNFILGLLAAAHGNCLESVRFLADYGINLDIHDEGITCLISAASEGNIQMVKMLLKYGANPLQKDDEGRTAFDYAKKKSIRKILKKAMEARTIIKTRFRVFVSTGKNDIIAAKAYFDGSADIKCKELIMLEDGQATDYLKNLKYRRILN